MLERDVIFILSTKKQESILKRSLILKLNKVTGLERYNIMRIVTWNCNGAFRKKYSRLKIDDKYPDILVIQECENPKVVKYPLEFEHEYKYKLWVGGNKNKGLGIFSKIEIIENNWDSENLKYFISCNIDNKFNLLGIWSHQADSPTFKYIGQIWKYIRLHKNNISSKDIMLIGDFNSNKIWDVWDRWWNHSDVVDKLNKMNILSFYHKYYEQEQGEELTPTYFHWKKLEKEFHIDYVFGSEKIYKNLQNMEIGQYDNWIDVSDHMPMILNMNFILKK